MVQLIVFKILFFYLINFTSYQFKILGWNDYTSHGCIRATPKLCIIHWFDVTKGIFDSYLLDKSCFIFIEKIKILRLAAFYIKIFFVLLKIKKAHLPILNFVLFDEIKWNAFLNCVSNRKKNFVPKYIDFSLVAA